MSSVHHRGFCPVRARNIAVKLSTETLALLIKSRCSCDFPKKRYKVLLSIWCHAVASFFLKIFTVTANLDINSEEAGDVSGVMKAL